MSVQTEDRSGGVRTVLLDRASKRNALNLMIVEALQDALTTAPGPAVVLGSTDSSSFSAGADLGLDDTGRAAVSESLYGLYLSMRSTPKIVIAAASGHAIGGGAQLLLASDIRIASPDLIIQFMGPGHGLAVGAWGLPSLVGRGRAMDLCLSMRQVGSEEALSIGLVDMVIDDPLEHAIEYAIGVSKLDHLAVAAVKNVISAGESLDALRREAQYNSTWDGAVPTRQRRSEQAK